MKINKETYNRNLKTFMAHEVIFREGEIGSYMYVILDGEIEIRKRVDAKTTRTMITLRKGDFFGEMSVIDKKPRSATAVTVSGCRLLRVDVKVFHELIQRNPDFAMKMIKTLSSRLRNTDSILEEVMSVDIQRRILAGVGAYLQGQGNVHEGKSSVFNASQFIPWAARHLGITEEAAAAALTSLLSKNLLHKLNTGTDDRIRVSEHLLAKVLSVE